MQMTVKSFGPRGAVGGCEVNIEGLEAVFVVDAICEDLRARLCCSDAWDFAQVMKVCWEVMCEWRGYRWRTYKVGGLTVAAFPEPAKLLHALRELPLPGSWLLVLFEVIEEMVKSGFFFTRHVVFEEVGDVEEERDVDTEHVIVKVHWVSCGVAVDCLLGTREGKRWEVQVEFERPVHEQELNSLEERIDHTLAVQLQNILQKVGSLDIATKLYEILRALFIDDLN